MPAPVVYPRKYPENSVKTFFQCNELAALTFLSGSAVAPWLGRIDSAGDLVEEDAGLYQRLHCKYSETEAVVPPNPRAVGDIILSANVADPRSIWLLGALEKL